MCVLIFLLAFTTHIFFFFGREDCHGRDPTILYIYISCIFMYYFCVSAFVFLPRNICPLSLCDAGEIPLGRLRLSPQRNVGPPGRSRPLRLPMRLLPYSGSCII